MGLKDKFNLFKQDWAHVFSIKSGKAIEKGNKCYQVSKWIAWIFHFYYYSGLPFFLILFLIYSSSIFSDIFYMRVFYSILSILIFEFFLFILIPLKYVKCWEVYKIGRDKK